MGEREEIDRKKEGEREMITRKERDSQQDRGRIKQEEINEID